MMDIGLVPEKFFFSLWRF